MTVTHPHTPYHALDIAFRLAVVGMALALVVYTAWRIVVDLPGR